MFQVRVLRDDDHRVVVELFGELDLVSMDRFEQVVAEVLSSRPRELIFDLTRSQFISIQGYAAIGRCSLAVHVSVRPGTELTSRILAICGYERVTIVPPRKPSPQGSC